MKSRYCSLLLLFFIVLSWRSGRPETVPRRGGRDFVVTIRAELPAAVEKSGLWIPKRRGDQIYGSGNSRSSLISRGPSILKSRCLSRPAVGLTNDTALHTGTSMDPGSDGVAGSVAVDE
jgi:hypothetical protein